MLVHVNVVAKGLGLYTQSEALGGQDTTGIFVRKHSVFSLTMLWVISILRNLTNHPSRGCFHGPFRGFGSARWNTRFRNDGCHVVKTLTVVPKMAVVRSYCPFRSQGS